MTLPSIYLYYDAVVLPMISDIHMLCLSFVTYILLYSILPPCRE